MHRFRTRVVEHTYEISVIWGQQTNNVSLVVRPRKANSFHVATIFGELILAAMGTPSRPSRGVR